MNKNTAFKAYRSSKIDSTPDSKIARINKIKATKRATPKNAIENAVKKIKSTKLERYGDANFNNSAAASEKQLTAFINSISVSNYEKLNDPQHLLHEYEIGHSAYAIAKSLGVTASTVVRKMHEFNLDMRKPGFIFRSNGEIELCEFLDSLNVEYEISNRSIIKPFELDVYLPGYKLAIEFNGAFWHSEINGKDKDYHLNKTTLCENVGIQLLHIFDCEWNDTAKRDIWKSIIKNKLGLSTKVYARKCTIRQDIPITEVRNFLNKNHIQGYANCSSNFGLYKDDELVAIMTFAKNRFSTKAEYELIRFCNKIDHTVVGGFSKLLNFYKTVFGKSLLSYANRRWSIGDVYNVNGFTLENISSPNYFYTNDYENLFTRHNFQKHKLKNLLPNFNEAVSEWDNMRNHGYDRIWDCGNLVYKYNIENSSALHALRSASRKSAVNYHGGDLPLRSINN